MGLRRVIKVGTSLLRGDSERPTAAVIADLAATMARQQRLGDSLALVTSGAVGLGCEALGHGRRPTEVVALQAAAAVGQGRLMALYQDAFAVRGLPVAQVLLTRGDLASRRRYRNAARTLEQLLAWGVVPVARQRSLPVLMNCSTAGAPTEAKSNRPASRSVSCGPEPRYGTCSMKVSLTIFRYSTARCPALPLPAEP